MLVDSQKQDKNLASKGRYGDTMLAHINPQEAGMLRAMGGAGTINPQTGLREFFDVNFLQSLLPPLEPLPSLGQALNPQSLANLNTQLGMETTPATYTGGLGFKPASEQIAPQYSQYADLSPATGMGGGRQVQGYTIPSDQTFQGKPLEAKYDTKGNFQYLTIAGGDYLPTDPNQPNIVSSPRINAKGEIIDYGVFDLSKQDNGSFGSFIGGVAKDFTPMILAGLGANLGLSSGLFPGAAGGAAGASSVPLGPYVSQAAGAYGGSSAAAAAAAAGNLTGIKTASGIQNALTQEALGRIGTTYGGNTTPADINGPTTPTPPAPEPPVTPPPVEPPVEPPVVTSPNISGAMSAGQTAYDIAPTITASTVGQMPDLSSLGDAGAAILKFAKDNPSIAGTLLGAVTSAIGSANAPKSTTTTSSIDPQIKAEYLANLERAKATAAGLEARQIAQPGAMYTGAEQQLYNLGMTPFGAADIAKFYNPYQEQVVQGALGDIERTRLMQEQANRDQATRARAFGGSRQGVVTGMTNEAALRQAATTGAQLRSAGFTQAANLGLQARPMDIAGLQTSLGLGTTRTALEQARLDALRNLGTERLGITSGALGLQPANVGGTTSQPLYNNTAGNLLSGGLTGAYIGSLLQPKTS